MQAAAIYDLAAKCYNGNEEARAAWFARLSPFAMAVGVAYGVLPGVILARAALESGWGSDLYELSMEKRFGVTFERKAQKHNNFVGMVAYGGNDQYAPALPLPAWDDYKATFTDWAPHGDMAGDYSICKEPWKEYRNIEDCFEDFAAVLRAQAWRRGEDWPRDLVGQLLSIGRGYTPEGGKSERGMVYAWQDNTLELYNKYKLYQYDTEVVKMAKQKVTVEALDKAIKAAYQYAHAHCKYGRTDIHYPPGEAGQIDCVGLVYRAFYTLGHFPRMLNIDQVADVCTAAGLAKTTDPADVWRHHCVVCMQDSNNIGTQHVNHVYYSLGGKSEKDISKYDLGSDERIQTIQPYKHVPVNEWKDRHFLCAFYALPDSVEYTDKTYYLGTIKKDVGMYTGPGTEYRKIKSLKPGATVIYGLRVTNPAGLDWRHIYADGQTGWVYYAAIERHKVTKAYKTQTRSDISDGFAAVRVGAGVDCPETFRIPAGAEITVDGQAKDAAGADWLHVYIVDGKGEKRRGYIYAGLAE